MFPISDDVPSKHIPIVTWLLILVNVLIFLLELACPEYAREQIIYIFGIVPRRYTDAHWASLVGFSYNNLWNYWPFFTHMFLHGSWLHIISNMWALWIFGDNVEDRMGPIRFLLFYLICGIIAACIHLSLHPDSTVPTIGASGAISGVLGAYFLLFPLANVLVMIPILIFPFFFVLPAFIYIGIWFLLQFMSGTASLVTPQAAGGIAWWAHIGGFVAGLLLCNLFVSRDYKQGTKNLMYQQKTAISDAWTKY